MDIRSLSAQRGFNLILVLLANKIFESDSKQFIDADIERDGGRPNVMDGCVRRSAFACGSPIYALMRLCVCARTLLYVLYSLLYSTVYVCVAQTHHHSSEQNPPLNRHMIFAHIPS